MPDREKVIKGLEQTAARLQYGSLDNVTLGECEDAVFDALDLLREQEPAEPTKQHIEKPKVDQWYCGECGGWIGKTFAYCPWCGKAVKWDA